MDLYIVTVEGEGPGFGSQYHVMVLAEDVPQARGLASLWLQAAHPLLDATYAISANIYRGKARALGEV